MSHKKTFQLGLLALLLAALSPFSVMGQGLTGLPDAEERFYPGPEEKIEQLLLDFYEASTYGDIEAIAGLTSKAPDAMFFGTDPSEVIVGYNEIIEWWQGIFDGLASIGYPNNGGLPITATGSPIQIGHRGIAAWVADDPVFEFLGGDVPFRLTLVLRLEWDGWKIVQGHFSIGVPDTELPVFP